MLITDQRKLSRLLIVLQDEISFFLSNIHADSGETGRIACSEFFEGITSFLKHAAEDDFQQFSGKIAVMRVNTPKLENLVLMLQADVLLFVTALKMTPTDLDEVARSGFLKRIFDLLGESAHWMPHKDSSSVTSHATPIPAPKHVLRNPASNINDRVSPYLMSGLDLSLVKRKQQARGNWTSGDHRSTILFSNACPGTTLLDISELCCCGALQSIERHEPYRFHVGWSFSNSFLIQFVKPEAAKAFLAFLKSPDGDHYLPTDQDSNVVVELVHPRKDLVTSKTHSIISPQPNPARRALIFQNYPVESVSKDQLIEKFRELFGGVSFMAHTMLTFQTFPATGEIHLLFSRVEIAIKIMEFHSLGLLGDDFSNSHVLFGKDPSDRPIPAEIEINVAAQASIITEICSKNHIV